MFKPNSESALWKALCPLFPPLIWMTQVESYTEIRPWVSEWGGFYDLEGRSWIAGHAYPAHRVRLEGTADKWQHRVPLFSNPRGLWHRSRERREQIPSIESPSLIIGYDLWDTASTFGRGNMNGSESMVTQHNS